MLRYFPLCHLRNLFWPRKCPLGGWQARFFSHHLPTRCFLLSGWSPRRTQKTTPYPPSFPPSGRFGLRFSLHGCSSSARVHYQPKLTSRQPSNCSLSTCRVSVCWVVCGRVNILLIAVGRWVAPFHVPFSKLSVPFLNGWCRICLVCSSLSIIWTISWLSALQGLDLPDIVGHSPAHV